MRFTLVAWENRAVFCQSSPSANGEVGRYLLSGEAITVCWVGNKQGRDHHPHPSPIAYVPPKQS